MPDSCTKVMSKGELRQQSVPVRQIRDTQGFYSVLLRRILQRRMFPAYDGLAASSIVGFRFPFGLFGRGQAMEGPGLGFRGRYASLVQPRVSVRTW